MQGTSALGTYFVNRADVAELHYIVAIGNVQSIMQHGILCFREAKRLPHQSVAMAEVQQLRQAKQVPPGTRTVHDYANLYFDARNPMMSKRRAYHAGICVLRVRHEVLDLAGVMITDQNAASNYVRFHPSPSGLSVLDSARIYAAEWTHEDTIEYWRRKSAKCAEVLVPDGVQPSFVSGAYVSGPVGYAALLAVGFTLSITLDPNLFFVI